MNIHDFYDLISATVHNEDEFDTLRFAGVTAFRTAVARLEQAGLSQHQLQLLIRRAFSRFDEDAFLYVQVLALALDRGTATVAEWHESLRNRAFLTRMHGWEFGFQTETLPDLASIDAELGLTPPCRRLPSPLEIRESCGSVDCTHPLEAGTA